MWRSNPCSIPYCTIFPVTDNVCVCVCFQSYLLALITPDKDFLSVYSSTASQRRRTRRRRLYPLSDH